MNAPVHAFAIDKQQAKYLIRDLQNCLKQGAESVFILNDPNAGPSDRSENFNPSLDDIPAPDSVSVGLLITVGLGNSLDEVVEGLNDIPKEG